MGVVVVFWPTFYLPSYLRWRIPALAFLRVGLFAMPFNFSTEVFDAIAPDVNTGRLALVSNFFQLSMGAQGTREGRGRVHSCVCMSFVHVCIVCVCAPCSRLTCSRRPSQRHPPHAPPPPAAIRIALLTFTSVGWRVPHRLHMVLQAINVCMLIKFGLHNYCRSKARGTGEGRGLGVMRAHVPPAALHCCTALPMAAPRCGRPFPLPRAPCRLPLQLLTSPEMETAIASVHSLIAFSAAMFVPSTGILAPEGVDAQRVAFLLLCWAIFGW